MRYHAARGLIYLGCMDVGGIYLFKRVPGKSRAEFLNLKKQWKTFDLYGIIFLVCCHIFLCTVHLTTALVSVGAVVISKIPVGRRLEMLYFVGV